MSVNGFDNFSNNLTPKKICNLIELEYQPEILNLCTNIDKYFTKHPCTTEIPVATSELTHLLFNKLQDEVKHLFLKESGIVFPCIIKKYTRGAKIYNKNCLDSNVSETVHQNQVMIIDLIEKIRALLNGFTIEPEWNKELKKCMARLFILETKILEWIHIEQKFLYPKVTGQNKLYLHSPNNFSIFSLN
jgi:iron-sulfur cluster repair protein YtfE (RIC family)